jgi:Cof subfamily protein (haloacid dehalogenase superfamily)
MSIKLITSDIDETLIRRDQSIPNENIEAIEKIKNLGICFAISTGRMDFCCTSIYKKAGAQYGIFGNGIKVVDLLKNKIIYEDIIDKDVVIDCIKLARKNNKHVHIYTENKIVSEKLMYHDLRYYKVNMGLKKEYKIKIHLTHDILKYTQNTKEKVMKILISDDNVMRELAIELKPILYKKAKIVVESENIKDGVTGKTFSYFEIVPYEATKAVGICKLAKYLKLNSKEVMAIGDGLNDIEILKTVGIGVAVANAQEGTKSVADYVTKRTNNEGAVAEAIEKFVLAE